MDYHRVVHPKAPSILRPEAGPDTLLDKPWGGTRLAALRGVEASRTIGESWEFSTVTGRESVASGRPLSSYLDGPLPFLAKLIDTARPLSIQVHPRDGAVAGQLGKEEAWVILDADDGAVVLAGTRDGVTLAQLTEATEQAVANPDRDDELIQCLEAIPVERGMCILVPGGTVHAIGPGVLLAEIQQPTDCTYRLFDYGSSRQLHVEQALGVVEVGARPVVGRAGDTGAITGEHVSLARVEPGTHCVEIDEPRLVIGVTGTVTLRSASSTEILSRGQLALGLHGTLDVEVSAGGLAVLGSSLG